MGGAWKVRWEGQDGQDTFAENGELDGRATRAGPVCSIESPSVWER